MALVTQFVCIKCEQPKFEVVSHTRICSDCRTRIKELEKQLFMANRSDMSIEARLEYLEEKLYDLDAENRLLRLEALNTKYS